MDHARTTNWRLVALIWLAGLGAAAQYGKISVIFADLHALYPRAGASLGFTVSLVGFLGILLGVVAGVLVARIGYRRALLSALLTGAALSVFQSFFPALPLFLASRILEGAAHLAIVVAAPTLIAQLTAPRDRGLALSLWGTFFGVAYAFLAWAGVPFAHAYGLPALMLAHAAYLALMAALLWPVLPRITAGAAMPRLSDIIAAQRRIYRDPRVGAAGIGWLFYAFSFVGLLTVLPPYIEESRRALVIGAMPLISIFTSLTLAVWLMRRIPAWGVVVTGFLLCAVLAVLLIVFPGQPALALAVGVGMGLVQGSGFALVPQLNAEPADQALANGGMAQTGNLGNTLGTPVMVAVLGAWGYPGLMTALLAVFLSGAACHLVLARLRLGRGWA